MNAKTVVDEVRTSFGGKIPHNAEEIVNMMIESKNLGFTSMDRIQGQFPNCTDGFFMAAKKTISEQRKAMNWQPRSRAAARAIRILKIRNSDGKETNRPW